MKISNRALKIAIASGKGGTGKTLLSTNLAAYIAEREQVVLADLDVEEPNSSLFFNIEEVETLPQYKMVPEWNPKRCKLCGLCTKVCNFGAVVNMGDSIEVLHQLCHNCWACSELCPTASLPMVERNMGEINLFKRGDLNLVEGRLNVNEEHSVPLIAKVHKYVERSYPEVRYQLFDSPPGTSCSVVEATIKADYVILVTEPTPFGLNDLTLTVEMLKSIGKRAGVVINRAGVGEEKIEEYCREVGVDLLGSIPYSEKIAYNYSKGDLQIDRSYFREPLEAIFERLESLNLKGGENE